LFVLIGRLLGAIIGWCLIGASLKLTQKTQARFDRLLQCPAWKWNGSILEGVDDSGST